MPLLLRNPVCLVPLVNTRLQLELLVRALVLSVSRESMQMPPDLLLAACVLLASRLCLREHHLPLPVSIVLRVYITISKVNRLVLVVLLTPLLTLVKLFV